MTLTAVEAAWKFTPDRMGARLDPDHFQRLRHSVLLGHQFRRWVFGQSPFQIWTMQPQLGKSTMARWGAVWLFEMMRNPKVIIDSYGQHLSRTHGRFIRNTIRAHRAHLGVRIAADASAQADWSTTDGGRCLSVGVDGQVTGAEGGYFIIDDPHKGWREAQSVNARERVWMHYQGDIIQRLQDEPRVLIIMTRWHPDDLVGRVLADGGYPYEVTHLPALADHRLTPDGDPLGRADGEVVEPRRFRRSTMIARRNAAGPYIWNAQYQGSPSVPEGNILRRAWFGFRPHAPTRRDVLTWITSWDLSFTDGADASYVVGQLWAMTADDPHRFVLCDEVREQADYPRTRELFQAFARKHPQVEHHIVERKANGHALVADMQRLGVPGVIGLDPSWAPGGGEQGRKVAAAMLVSPLIAGGRVELAGWVPSGTPWLVEFLREVGEFPNGDHDDQVDAMTQALHWLDVRSESHYGRRATVIDERLFGRR